MDPQDQQECVSSGSGFVLIAVRDDFVVNFGFLAFAAAVQPQSALYLTGACPWR
jgi:hypothetical protein